MGKDEKPVPTQAPGQVPGPASVPAEPVQGAGTAPEYVTREEAARMVDEAMRKAQSSFDIGQNRLTKKVQARLQNLEEAWAIQAKAGVAVPDDASKDRIRSNVLSQTMTEPESPPQTPPTTPAQQPVTGAEVVDPLVQAINALALNRMQKAGVMIDEADPEYKQFVDPAVESEDPDDFLDAIGKAIAAKKIRLSSESLGKIPGAAGPGEVTSPLPEGLTPIQLFKLAYSKNP
jgi:hypothetical protein